MVDAGRYRAEGGLFRDRSESDVEGVGRRLDAIELGVAIDSVDALFVV